MNDKKFTIWNLKEGDIITLRNGDRLIYLENENGSFADLTLENDNLVSNLFDFSDNLKFIADTRPIGVKKEKYDIIKVKRPILYNTIYEENENRKQMTIKEIEKALGYKIEIID